jgi:iron complex transport system ATP-binding protein
MLSARDLTVHSGQRVLLEAVSLAVDCGELLAIVGPNGAGKSTLLKALLGLMAHTGSVELGGVPAQQLSAAERARTLAYVPQRSSLTAALAVRDVVAQARYARGETRPDLTEVLEQTELTALAQRSFVTLSGGEQRRVLIARALATGARTLLLDEPTAGLDIAHVLRFYRLAARLKASGHALVCVLHDLVDVQRYADRALLLAAGRVVSVGPVTAVLSAANIAHVYGVQTHAQAALGFSLDGRWP